MTPTTRSRWYLVAKYRSPYLALAVLDGMRIVEVMTHRLCHGRRSSDQLHALFVRLATDYAPDRIIIEPMEPLYRAATATGVTVSTMTLTEAKRLLLGDAMARTNRDLYRSLVARCPELRRLVTILVGSGDIAVTEPWRTVQLLPIALGLAAQTLAAESTDEPSTHS